MSLTLLCVVIAAVGMGSLVLGFRGRRLDEHPVCRRCRFDLTGLNEGVRCPECGGDLAAKRAVRIGNRRRRGWAIGVGLPALLIGLIIGGADGWRYFSGFDLNTIKPTGLLVWELERMSPDRAGGIATELTNRVTQHIATASAPEADRKPVEKAHLERMRDRALAVQANRDRPWLPEWGDLLYELARTEAFAPEHWAAFVQNGVEWTLAVRTDIPHGATVRVRSTVTGRRLGSRYIGVLVQDCSVQIDGELLPVEHNDSRGLMLRQGAVTGVEARVAVDAEVGERFLSKRIVIDIERLRAMARPSGRDTDAAATRQEVTLTAPINILPAGSEVVRLVDDDETLRRLAESIRVGEVRGQGHWGAGTTHVSGSLTLDPHVIDLVLDAFVVVDDEEHRGRPMWLLSTTPGAPRSFSCDIRGYRPSDRVTLIFRPNLEAAIEVPGVTAIYGGELVFENVEMSWSGQSGCIDISRQ